MFLLFQNTGTSADNPYRYREKSENGKKDIACAGVYPNREMSNEKGANL